MLGVDYGSTVTVAVLAAPDGTWQPVPIDGSPVLPSAVAAGKGGQPLVGQVALTRLALAPHAGTTEPKRWLRPDPAGDGQTGHTEVDSPAVHAAAATLGRVAAAATQKLGQAAELVRMVVPATWGPRRRTLVRRAAHRAGLAEPPLATRPVAFAEFLTESGATWEVLAADAADAVSAGSSTPPNRLGLPRSPWRR